MKLAWKDAFSLALLPGAIALGVTLLRLAGELGHWSDSWFVRTTGGIVPSSAVGWIAGITWLALPFGCYFSWRLVRSGDRPGALSRVVLLALVAAFLLYAGARLSGLLLRPPALLPVVWSVAVVAAAIAWRAWPGLGRALAAYGLLSRLPVAVVMFLAMRGHWGTHYDYADLPQVAQLPLAAAYVFLAFVPQLVFWVAFTIVAGVLAGGLTAAVPVRPFATARARAVVTAALVFSAATLEATEPPPDTAVLAAAVRAREAAFARTMADRDHAAFTSFVSEEAVFAGRTVLRGRRAVAEGWKPFFEGKKAPFAWAPELVEVIDSGALALSSGPVFDPEGKRTGTFHSTWRREPDGVWRIVLDIGCPPCECR